MQYGFFEWDDEKAEQNAREHHVTFYDAEHSEEEGRYAGIGFSRKGRLLFVVFTPRGQRIRIISARTAEREEEKRYEQGS